MSVSLAERLGLVKVREVIKEKDLIEDDIFLALVDRTMALEKALLHLYEEHEQLKNNFKALEGGISLIAETLLKTNVLDGQEKNLKTIGGMIESMNSMHDNIGTIVRVLNEKGILTEEDLKED